MKSVFQCKIGFSVKHFLLAKVFLQIILTLSTPPPPVHLQTKNIWIVCEKVDSEPNQTICFCHYLIIYNIPHNHRSSSDDGIVQSGGLCSEDGRVNIVYSGSLCSHSCLRMGLPIQESFPMMLFKSTGRTRTYDASFSPR